MNTDLLKSMFEGLIDDAALFPPRNALMADALSGHRRQRSGPYNLLLGRFLCPASRVGQLLEQLAPDDHLELGVIADTRLAGLADALALVAADPRVNVALVELPLPAGPDPLAAAKMTVRALPPVDSYVELPRVTGWQDALAELAAASRGAKLRTGGLSTDQFPTEAEVAAFIVACVAASVPFKCTAGLHHAVRYRDRLTGFQHHGFLNVLLATCAAVDGADEGAVVGVLAATDGAALAHQALALTVELGVRGRRRFVAYGSCSLAEPVGDLIQLGLLAAPGRL